MDDQPRTLYLSFGIPFLAYGVLVALILALVSAPLWLYLVAPLAAIPLLVWRLRRLAAQTPDPAPALPAVADRDPGIDLDEAWEDALEQLRLAVPNSTFRLWLEPLEPVGIEGETLRLSAPPGVAQWAERRYSSLIAEALTDVTKSLRHVRFDLTPAATVQFVRTGIELNPNYSFERFVIYPGNRLAHGAALAVAERPFDTYSPLFIHGPPGLGRTHLLTAIANYLNENASGLRVHYTTAESFTNEFIAALRTRGVEAFKALYRESDVLLIDDVQFLEGKPATEEEFFHTFNALYEARAQLVLSADRPPSELSSLSTSLRDRLDSGLTIGVEPPDAASRLRVLQRLVQEAGVEIDDDKALPELAERTGVNVRQLHGALTRVLAHASLMARPLSSELVAEVIPRTRSAQAISVEEIQQRVAERFGVSRAELVGSSRAATPLRARQVAIFLTRELTELSLPQIGRLYGGRNHTTVLNSLRRAETSLAEDEELSERLQELRAELLQNPSGRPRA